jgi:hypothetical protein
MTFIRGFPEQMSGLRFPITTILIQVPPPQKKSEAILLGLSHTYEMVYVHV